MNVQISGPYCPINSYLRGKLTSRWVSSEDTDIRATFARVCNPYYESAYDEVTQTDWLEIGGFK